MCRSVSADLELEPGTYSVLMKITSKRWPTDPTPEQIIKQTCKDRPEKLTQVGLAYDLAHAKGQVKETEKEKTQRKEREEKKKLAARKKEREELRAARLKQWQLEKKLRAREKRHAKRKEEHERKRAEKKKLTMPRDAPVADENTAPNINGDITDKNTPEKEVTVPTAVVPQTAEPQPDAPVTTATLAQNTPSKDQPTNGVPPEDENTKPESDAPATPVSLVQDVPSKNQLTNGFPPDIEKTNLQQDAADPARGNIADEPSEAKAIVEVSVETKSVDETKAEQFHNALQSIPSVQVNGEFVSASIALAPSTVAGPDDWQYDSDASFDSSIDSDLDFPPEPPAEVVVEAVAEEDEENAEFADDPWNAVCVVGLRVYSKDSELSVEIVRPRHEEEDGDTPLDVDDASKGASVEKVA